MPPRKPTDTVNLRIRLPEGLRKLLATEAERNKRSLNSEIVWRLGETLGPEGDFYIKEHASMEERLAQELNKAVKLLIEDKEYIERLKEEMRLQEEKRDRKR
jgi:hypothetical protein